MSKPKNNFSRRTGSSPAMIWNADTVDRRRAANARSKTEYPAGRIGADPIKRNYIKYLVERYHRFRQAEPSSGKSSGRLSYVLIYKNIEAKFKLPAYFVPVGRFDELVDYLQARIDRTVLGKRNRARGYSNYESFDESEFTQMAEAR